MHNKRKHLRKDEEEQSRRNFGRTEMDIFCSVFTFYSP
jgi:hypothetical protein